MGLSLSELLRDAGLKSDVASNPVVAGISEDSRKVRAGWVFVAVSGTRESGQRYVEDAIGRGAVAVVSEAPIDVQVPAIQVMDARETLADLAAAYYGRPSQRIDVLGVTGTDGKTTTCFLLAGILGSAGLATGLITTVQTRTSTKSLTQQERLTTPSAPFVQSALAEMVAAGDRYGVVECSSHALVQERLRNVTLQAAAITNVSSDHIEFHGSQEAYEEAKSRIAGLLRPDQPALVINGQDPGALRVAETTAARVITFGLGSEFDLEATGLLAGVLESRFAVRWRNQQANAVLPIGGVHNVRNALAAVGLALSAGLPLDAAVSGLSTAQLPPGRLQRVEEGQVFSVFVDYAHTEQAFRAVVTFLSNGAREQTGRLIAVFGAAGDRDRAKRPRLAEIASELCDYFIITNEDPFGEEAADILNQIAAGAPASQKGLQWRVEPDRRTAIEAAVSMAGQKDIVVITGKGHETSIAEGDRSIPWSDEAVTREILRSLVTAEPR